MVFCGDGAAIGGEPPCGCGFLRIEAARESTEDAKAARPHHLGMAASYAVTWAEPDGSVLSGRLELDTELLRLHGQTGTEPVDHEVLYRDVAGYRMARGTGERLNGRPTLILELSSGDSIRLASVAQYGIVSELASRLASLHHA
jgi:hypothetical protein